MIVNDKSDGGLEKFALELLKELGKVGIAKLFAALTKVLWHQDPSEEEDVAERGAGDTCLGVKKPTTPPDGVGPNGHYACRTNGWVWVEDIG